jgi:DNA-binding LacI/PurR family transcriptional regulator
MGRRLADVAKKVGVSEATVSRVPNNRPDSGPGSAGHCWR